MPKHVDFERHDIEAMLGQNGHGMVVVHLLMAVAMQCPGDVFLQPVRVPVFGNHLGMIDQHLDQAGHVRRG